MKGQVYVGLMMCDLSVNVVEILGVCYTVSVYFR